MVHNSQLGNGSILLSLLGLTSSPLKWIAGVYIYILFILEGEQLEAEFDIQGTKASYLQKYREAPNKVSTSTRLISQTRA